MDIYNPVYPGLYYFDTFTFTTLGTSGHRGPDSTKTYANAPWREGDFSIVDGQQQWTVPATGTYRIEAAGAYGATPGRVVSGEVDLNEGQVVSLLVGQQPTPLTANVVDNVTVGGGGGTFVTVDGKPLIVASGGDGGAYSTGYQSTTFVDPGTVQFGISMSSDGNTILIQTINLNTFAVGFSIYTYVNSIWTYKTSLSPTFTSYNVTILKISGDGTTFVYFVPTTPSFPYVLVYQYDTVNSVWIPTPVTLQNPVNFYRNGSTIDISYDGSTIIRSFVSSVDSQGHACVYTKNPDLTWSSPVVLNEPGANYWLDTTVAISGDGLTACVGAQSSSPVIVYKKTGGNWNQDSTLSYNPQKISMSYDGSVVAFMFSDHVSITNGVTISYTSPAYIQLSNDGTKLLVARYDNVTIYTGSTPTVVTQYINYNNNTAASMNATGSRITSLEISITDPKIDVFDIGTGGAPGSFTPSGTGVGISGAGYLTDGEVSSPYFGFLKPQAYVDGGYGNMYWYGHKGEGGFGGGQSPLNILTSLTSIVGYNAIRPTIPLNSDQYIYSVDISDDGNTFLVTRSFSNSRVYVYQYTGSSWGATQLYDNKLYSVSMSLDGTVWLIQNDIWRNGSFETQLEVPEVISGAGGSTQGKNTCVSSDGNTAVITNTSYTYNIQYNSIPELYCNVYAYSSGSWNKINTFHIIHNSMVFGEPYTEVDNVATRCAISGDGNTMATGTRTYLNVYNGQSYVRQTIYVNVYVYKKTGGTWNQTKQITFEYPYGGAEGGSMNHLVIDYSGNKIVFPGYEYTCDTDTLTAFVDVSQLTTTITFSKTTTNVYAWSDGQTIYGPSTPDGFKVELVNSCTILAFGSNVLLTSDSTFSYNKAIVFVDMYDPTTTCTANTAVDHGYPHDYKVQITGTSSFNGTWDIVTTSSNTFTFQAFGGPTETSGYVSGTTTGISGGGGYTGSPGDGVSGATCYADPAVRNLTDLGASGNTAGTVTISLIDPTPLKQTWTWDQTFTSTAPVVPIEVISWSDKLEIFQSFSGTSKDGIHWDAITINDVANGAGSPFPFYIAYSDTLNLYVGLKLTASFDSVIYVTSSDGIIWNETTPIGLDVNNFEINVNGSSILWAPELSLFIFLTSTELYSSVDGINWTLGYSDPGFFTKCITYSPSLHTFVCCCNTQGLGYAGIYSTDGVTWNTWSVEGILPSISHSVTWSPKLSIFVSSINFVETIIVGEPPDTYEDYVYYSNIAHSTDGQTWSVDGFSVSREIGRFWNVIWGEGVDVFTAVPQYSSEQNNLYSYDGITWLTTTTSAYGPIGYSPTQKIFVVSQSSGYIQFVSIEGIYYVNLQEPYPDNSRFYTWSSQIGKFVTYNFNTSDCIHWEKNDTYIPYNPGKPIWSPELGLFVILTSYFYYYSYDGITWVGAEFNPTSVIEPYVAWSPTLGVFSGSFYSKDGKNWTLPMDFTAIGWSSFYNMFVAFNGTPAYYSYDGIIWNPGANGTGIGGGGDIVCSSSGRLVCAGQDTGVLYSDDGINWLYADIGFKPTNPLWIEELSIFVGAGIGGDTTIGYVSTNGIDWSLIPNYIQIVGWSPELGRFLCTGGYSQVTKTF